MNIGKDQQAIQSHIKWYAENMGRKYAWDSSLN